MTAGSESPDIVYGRLLESAHISGYGFERMVDEGQAVVYLGPDVTAFHREFAQFGAVLLVFRKAS